MESEVAEFHRLSGQFNFHSIQNNAPVFIRDGGKIDTFDAPPYYLVYDIGAWLFKDADMFGDEAWKNGGYMKLTTAGFRSKFSFLYHLKFLIKVYPFQIELMLRN